jgi:hypothetical protein
VEEILFMYIFGPRLHVIHIEGTPPTPVENKNQFYCTLRSTIAMSIARKANNKDFKKETDNSTKDS